MNTDQPAFLVGSERSGSTLLRLMLDSHPGIINPGECDFLFDLVGDDGRLPEVFTYRHWLSINRVFLAMHLKVDDRLEYRDLIRSFLNQISRPNTVLIVKVHRNLHRIPTLFPNARYIHLLRDPRDVARSCIGMGWAGHAFYGVDLWLEAEKSWDRLKSTLTKAQYFEVKYEDLLDNVEETLGTICEFLDLRYSAQMLDYANRSTYSRPDKSLSYQWKRKYSRRELQLVEGKVGPMLLDRGYKPSGHPPAFPGFIERVGLFIRHKGFCVRHAIRRYGMALYLRSFIASKLGIRVWQEACQKERNAIDTRYLK